MEKHKESINSIIKSRKIAYELKIALLGFLEFVAFVTFGVVLSAWLTDYSQKHPEQMDAIQDKFNKILEKLRAPVTSERV